MDLEWRPSFGTGGRPRASLLQVAMEGRVFLLDLLGFSQLPPGGPAVQALCRLLSRLLSDPTITKLGERGHQHPPPTREGIGRYPGVQHSEDPCLLAGYGMAGDLHSLGASFPVLVHVEKELQGGLDLMPVHKRVSALP